MYAYGVQKIMSLPNSIFPYQGTQLRVFNWQDLYHKDFAVVHVWRRQRSHKNELLNATIFVVALLFIWELSVYESLEGWRLMRRQCFKLRTNTKISLSFAT
jgi:hypothetical protein